MFFVSSGKRRGRPTAAGIERGQYKFRGRDVCGEGTLSRISTGEAAAASEPLTEEIARTSDFENDNSMEAEEENEERLDPETNIIRPLFKIKRMCERIAHLKHYRLT
jgi:hypothetical protein